MKMDRRKSLHFRCPDPMSREATSRTTRYRIIKKRKATESLGSSASGVLLPSDVQVEDEQDYVSGDVLESDSDRIVEEHQCDTVIDDEDEMLQLDTHSEQTAVYEVLTDLLPEEPGISELHLDEGEEDTDDLSVSDTVGSRAVVSSCSLLVKQYSVRHNLTQEALADLLKLLRLHSSTPSILPPSVYLFEKQFKPLKYPLHLHYFCSDCLQGLPDAQMACCPNESCKKSFNSTGAISSFIEMPLDLQLINLIQREYTI